MKNSHKGFIGMAVAIFIALFLGGAGAYYYQKSQMDNREVQNVSIDNSENYSDQKDATLKTETTKENDPLSQDDILKATYKIAANFGGVKTSLVNVIFPPHVGNNNALSGNIYINKSGEIVNSMSENLEAFWISKYEYFDSNKTKAKVYISGNFGASGYDNRVFEVVKIDGMVKTEEVTLLGNSTISDWKTYKNEKYEFQYPSNWYFINTTNISLEKSDVYKYQFGISENLKTVLSEFTSQGSVDNNLKYIQSLKREKTEGQEEVLLTTNGKALFGYYYVELDRPATPTAYIIGDNQVIRIMFDITNLVDGVSEEDWRTMLNEGTPIFKKILSTFKFTK